MSRIYFHTRDEGEVTVWGGERSHMGHVVRKFSETFLPYSFEDAQPFLIPGLPMSSMRDVALYFGVERATFKREGEELSNFSLQLNTVLAVANDPVCLLARLHGQCEIHAYVEGPHRAWMAGLIKQGLESRVYREGVGWDKVVTLLEQSNTEPVVTSYSVCESFPNEGAANWEPPQVGPDEDDVNHDAWYEDYTDQERWDMAITGLRARQAQVVEICPDDLRTRYDHRLTLMELFPWKLSR